MDEKKRKPKVDELDPALGETPTGSEEEASSELSGFRKDFGEESRDAASDASDASESRGSLSASIGKNRGNSGKDPREDPDFDTGVWEDAREEDAGLVSAFYDDDLRKEEEEEEQVEEGGSEKGKLRDLTEALQHILGVIDEYASGFRPAMVEGQRARDGGSSDDDSNGSGSAGDVAKRSRWRELFSSALRPVEREDVKNLLEEDESRSRQELDEVRARLERWSAMNGNPPYDYTMTPAELLLSKGLDAYLGYDQWEDDSHRPRTIELQLRRGRLDARWRFVTRHGTRFDDYRLADGEMAFPYDDAFFDLEERARRSFSHPDSFKDDFLSLPVNSCLSFPVAGDKKDGESRASVELPSDGQSGAYAPTHWKASDGTLAISSAESNPVRDEDSESDGKRSLSILLSYDDDGRANVTVLGDSSNGNSDDGEVSSPLSSGDWHVALAKSLRELSGHRAEFAVVADSGSEDAKDEKRSGAEIDENDEREEGEEKDEEGNSVDDHAFVGELTSELRNLRHKLRAENWLAEHGAPVAYEREIVMKRRLTFRENMAQKQERQIRAFIKRRANTLIGLSSKARVTPRSLWKDVLAIPPAMFVDLVLAKRPALNADGFVLWGHRIPFGLAIAKQLGLPEEDFRFDEVGYYYYVGANPKGALSMIEASGFLVDPDAMPEGVSVLPSPDGRLEGLIVTLIDEVLEERLFPLVSDKELPHAQLLPTFMREYHQRLTMDAIDDSWMRGKSSGARRDIVSFEDYVKNRNDLDNGFI